jgi:hypothetical protein
MVKKIEECNNMPKVPICKISDQIRQYQATHILNTGRYISVPRAIVKMIQEKY